ncbi:MAG TPA: holo-ACP synthase [Clostridia bacterium]|jgi:holo-[acyl-carrier protein] synthase|nr:MAG: Holo-(acyl-carrier-protein) synthase [Firmicutes bacterium ADurb.Bin146]HOD92784.1 holo-ACP synthase [Clostridia bacterium]HQM39554.1 holo-ACP synthase [Clostridia bacterium]
MRIACGTDILENKRIMDAVNRSEKFLEKNFTNKEIEYCKSKKILMAQSLAARFAAKEAVAKALGTGFRGTVQPIQIEIANDKKGKPYVILGEDLKKDFSDVMDISISLSHCNEYSVAHAVITFKEV